MKERIDKILVDRGLFDSRERAKKNIMAGTVLVNNMVVGVSEGYKKTLELVGVGYRAQLQGKKLVMNLGFSHPVEFEAIDGIEFEIVSPTKLIVKGIDKELVGDVSADIRAWRKPEPYKGKGIKFEGEVIRRKVGKTGK